MNMRKLLRIAQQLSLFMCLAFCLDLLAEETYLSKKVEFVNSTAQTVEALCREGDEAVEGLCNSRHESVRPSGRDVDYPIEREKLANGVRCKPYFVRYDQSVTVFAQVACRASKANVSKRDMPTAAELLVTEAKFDRH